MALAKAGLPFRIIPGVSSGLASLALHGIPATTRSTNHAVILATGHCAAGEDRLGGARARGIPIVLYMAVANVAAIVPALCTAVFHRHPRSPFTRRRPDETVVEARSTACRACGGGSLQSPAILAIGAIAAFRSAIRMPPRPKAGAAP